MTTITIYTTPACGQCKLTKNWWKRKGITNYNEVNLEEHPQHLPAIRELGYQRAPVVIVNDDDDTRNEKHWYGFRPDLLEEFTLTTKAA